MNDERNTSSIVADTIGTVVLMVIFAVVVVLMLAT